MLLRRKGVNNPGPEEQAAYILQNQLTNGESARWISLANADERISDATLHELELRVADARSGRHLCPPETLRRSSPPAASTSGTSSMNKGPRSVPLQPGLRSPPAPTTSTRTRRRGGHHPPRCPPQTSEPWWRTSRPCTQSAGTKQTGLCRGTTAHQRNQSRFATRPSSPSARHPDNASAAPRSNARPKDLSRTGSASTTGRMHPKLTAPSGSPARAPAGATALEGAGPGPASIQLPLQPPPGGRGWDGSGQRPA